MASIFCKVDACFVVDIRTYSKMNSKSLLGLSIAGNLVLLSVLAAQNTHPTKQSDSMRDGTPGRDIDIETLRTMRAKERALLLASIQANKIDDAKISLLRSLQTDIGSLYGPPFLSGDDSCEIATTLQRKAGLADMANSSSKEVREEVERLRSTAEEIARKCHVPASTTNQPQ